MDANNLKLTLIQAMARYRQATSLTWVNVDTDLFHNMTLLFHNGLTHWGRATHICVSKLTIVASDNGFVAWLVPSPYLNQCWNIVNLKWNSYIFIQENAFENVVCVMAAILSIGEWVTSETTCALIPAWISNYIYCKVWDEFTYPFPNFNSCSWKWISNFIPHFTGLLNIYPCWD